MSDLIAFLILVAIGLSVSLVPVLLVLRFLLLPRMSSKLVWPSPVPSTTGSPAAEQGPEVAAQPNRLLHDEVRIVRLESEYASRIRLDRSRVDAVYRIAGDLGGVVLNAASDLVDKSYSRAVVELDQRPTVSLKPTFKAELAASVLVAAFSCPPTVYNAPVRVEPRTRDVRDGTSAGAVA